jgi:endonuclease III
MGLSATNEVIRVLVARVPGCFSSELGLNLSIRRQRDLFLWFLAALLYGARISGSIVRKTHAEFVRRGITNPEAIVKTGWDGLVRALDAGGYVRYDYKTATKLLEVMKHLRNQYDGNLQRLHAVSSNAADLENRLKGLGKGIGEVTGQIFLRELRGIWAKAQPALSPLGILAMKDLELCSRVHGSGDHATVERLRVLWKQAGVKGKSFGDFESALVRLGRDHCRRQRKQDCPLREFCTRRRIGRFRRGGRYGRGGEKQP